MDFQLARSLEDEKIYVKSFPGSTTQHMKEYYSKPSLEREYDRIVYHVGTNDLNSDKEAEEIAKENCRSGHLKPK